MPSRDAGPHPVFVVTVVCSARGSWSRHRYQLLNPLSDPWRDSALCSVILKTSSYLPSQQRIRWSGWAFGSLEAAERDWVPAWAGAVVTLRLGATSPFQYGPTWPPADTAGSLGCPSCWPPAGETPARWQQGCSKGLSRCPFLRGGGGVQTRVRTGVDSLGQEAGGAGQKPSSGSHQLSEPVPSSLN